jgi:hypothetical protein
VPVPLRCEKVGIGCPSIFVRFVPVYPSI